MTLLESTVVGPEDDRPDQITVWVGFHGTSRGLPSSGSLLVVEADPDRAKELRHVLRGHQDLLICENVLTADNGVMVQWNYFNDARFSGPIGQAQLQERYPNLQLIRQELRCGRSLGDLLDSWAPRLRDLAMSQLHLILRQGDPLAALTGLGPWLSQLETVQLMLAWPAETMRQVETWLGQHSLRQDPHIPTLWKLDPIAKRDWLLNEKEKEKQALLDANQQIKVECKEMQAEKDLLLEKVEKHSANLDKLIQTQALTVADLQESQAANEKLRLQLENHQDECRKLYKEKSDLLKKLETAEAAELDSNQALQSIFPMHLYREENIDLSDYDENMLLLHFIQNGRQEGRLKSYQELYSEWKSSLKQCEDAEIKLEQLEAQFGLVQLQLETMKDLFARLADRQESQRHEKKE